VIQEPAGPHSSPSSQDVLFHSTPCQDSVNKIPCRGGDGDLCGLVDYGAVRVVEGELYRAGLGGFKTADGIESRRLSAHDPAQSALSVDEALHLRTVL